MNTYKINTLFEPFSLDVKNQGQVFTPSKIVNYMISLIANEGRVLEPSCGNGAFLKSLSLRALGALGAWGKTTAIEKQTGLCKYSHLNIDFFDFHSTQLFDTIIGNPPYVRQQDIDSSTKLKLDYTLFDKRTNLYLFFIDKCIDLLSDNGELIFITPRDFLKQTSAIKLNQKLFDLGSFTHFDDYGDRNIFGSYTPNCAIWRWQKGLNAAQLKDGRFIKCIKGQIVFTKNNNNNLLKKLFKVKVGAVSGADFVFAQDSKKSIDFVNSKTRADGSLKKMIYNTYDEILLKYKKILLKRKVKKFNENNWWEWGRKYTQEKGKRIYVNCKTRKDRPFFVSDLEAYDGSILALIPKSNSINLNSACERLNDLDWNSLGFKCGGRYIFSQKSLENIVI